MENNHIQAARTAVEELLSASGLDKGARKEARTGLEALLKAKHSVKALRERLPGGGSHYQRDNLAEVGRTIDMALTDLACACSAFREEFAYVCDGKTIGAGVRLVEQDLGEILGRLKGE